MDQGSKGYFVTKGCPLKATHGLLGHVQVFWRYRVGKLPHGILGQVVGVPLEKDWRQVAALQAGYSNGVGRTGVGVAKRATGGSEFLRRIQLVAPEPKDARLGL